MIIDLIKLFPKSCAIQGIEKFQLNTNDIKNLKILLSDELKFDGADISEDLIELNNQSFRFPSIDNGIITLHSIVIAEKFIKDFESNSLMTENSARSEKHYKISKEYLEECALKYNPV